MVGRVRVKIWISIFVLFLSVLACNMPRGSSNDDAMPLQDQQTEQQPQTDDSSASLASTAELGLSRANPYPLDAEVSTTYWDFKVLEVARGEAAWQIIRADNPENPPPPSGKEYFLAKVEVRCKNTEPGSHDIGLDEFFVTGDHLKGYTDRLWNSPMPEFFHSDIYTAETLEGWIDVLVDTDEGNLMLVFDRAEYVGNEEQLREVRYLALESGAAIEVPANLDGIAPNDLGTDRENPAIVGDTVITNDFEFTIVEALQGQAALDFVMQLSEKNNSPDEGLEYVAFRVRVRRIGTEDVAELFSTFDFKAYAPGLGYNGSDQMKDPFINLDQSNLGKLLNGYLFPGAEIEGWVIKQFPVGHTPLLIEYKNVRPNTRSTDWDTRYILLEP